MNRKNRVQKSLAITSSVTLLRCFLIVILLVIILLLLLCLLHLVAILIVISEPTIEILILPSVAPILGRLGTPTASRQTLGHRISPAASCIPSVHLWEKKSQHGFTVSPVQVIQLNWYFLLLLGRLLRLIVLFRELASRFDKGQELWLRVVLLRGHFCLDLPTFLLFHLLHRL